MLRCHITIEKAARNLLGALSNSLRHSARDGAPEAALGSWPGVSRQHAGSCGSSNTPVAATPMAKYLDGRAKGLYREDPRQELTVTLLQELYDKVARHLKHVPVGRSKRPSGLTMVDSISAVSQSGKQEASWWSNLVGSGGNSAHSKHPHPHGGTAHGTHPEILGLYMFGGVGCGKTMLMDLFVDTAPPEFKVQRIHFHEFMLKVHCKLRKFKGLEDPLLKVADQISRDTKVLALDEFFVTDVADAAILSRLFARLWDRQLVLLATSNRQPDDLYKGGLQRNLFLPFIHRLKGECRAHDMDSGTDYRKLAHRQNGMYFTSTNKEELLEEQFVELSQGVGCFPASVDVLMGRTMEVPRASGNICVFSFQDLCGKPVAAADYIAITEAFHTVVLSGIPVITAANRPEAYRFVTLVDVLYEHRVRLICSADAAPLNLFEHVLTQEEAADRPQLKEQPNTVVDDNLGFAKDRTVSRLTEMQSVEYLLHHAESHAPCNLLALQELVQKSVKEDKQAVASL